MRVAGQIAWDNTAYLIIEEILNKKLDKLKPEAESVDIPSHNNIRGKEYYK